jgi:ABC-2 type transport system permease protein
MIALLAISGLISYFQTQQKVEVLVSDPLGVTQEDISGNSQVHIQYTETELTEPSQIGDKLQDFDAVVTLPSNSQLNPTEKINIQVYSSQPLQPTNEQFLRSSLQEGWQTIKLRELLGLSGDGIDFIQRQANIETKMLNTSGEEPSQQQQLAQPLAFISGFIIYFALILYGQMVMRGVLEEKTSRVVEIMMSSVQPIQLMLGKVLGIALMSLTQIGLWLAAIAALIFASVNITFLTSNLPINPQLILDFIQNSGLISLVAWLVFYFLIGYLLYASLFAAIGAAVDREKDVQNLTLPVTLPIIISLLLMFMVIQKPDGLVALWGSLIPFSSPILMLARLPFEVPWWQLTLSAIILLLSFVAITWLAARIYRTGILLYGKRPNVLEVAKWIFKREG